MLAKQVHSISAGESAVAIAISRKARVAAAVLAGVLGAGGLITAAAADPPAAAPQPALTAQSQGVGEPASEPAAPQFRRLNEVQYGRAVTQAFGPGIAVPGRFDPPLREHGL